MIVRMKVKDGTSDDILHYSDTITDECRPYMVHIHAIEPSQVDLELWIAVITTKQQKKNKHMSRNGRFLTAINSFFILIITNKFTPSIIGDVKIAHHVKFTRSQI